VTRRPLTTRGECAMIGVTGEKHMRENWNCGFSFGKPASIATRFSPGAAFRNRGPCISGDIC